MKDKEFICLGCKWAEEIDENRCWCNKVGFECNGYQSRPTHICEDYESKEESA